MNLNEVAEVEQLSELEFTYRGDHGSTSTSMYFFFLHRVS